MTGLLKLAERCEAATGNPAEHRFRMLDLDILRATEPDNTACRFGGQMGSDHYTTWEWTAGGVSYQHGSSWGVLPVPNFTASLDAAMTLVPGGWDWATGTGGSGNGGHSFMRPVGRHFPRIEADADSPALALCAAALRARDSRLKPDRAETPSGSAHESGGAVGNRPTSIGGQ